MLIYCMYNIVPIFCPYLECAYSIYVNYFSCLNKILKLFLSIIVFMMCLIFMSLPNYVQFILCADILMVILKLASGKRSTFI